MILNEIHILSNVGVGFRPISRRYFSNLVYFPSNQCFPSKWHTRLKSPCSVHPWKMLKSFFHQFLQRRRVLAQRFKPCWTAACFAKESAAFWNPRNPSVWRAINHWPWLRDRLIGGTYHVFLAHLLSHFREDPPNIWPYMVQYLRFRILPIWINIEIMGPANMN